MTGTSLDWSEDAFFEAPPERESLDGGTTTAGPLWHTIGQRWGHGMHTMCSYHGMFPARVAHHFIQRYSRPGDVVLDPFSGRGTVALQARVEGRRAIGNDLSPLAYVLTRAKADPPTWGGVHEYLAAVEATYRGQAQTDPDVPPDIKMLFHPNTLRQIVYLRDGLLSTPITEWTSEEAMIAGALAGILHGSHRKDRTSLYLSISMPNTFSMSPGYVKKFIREKKLKAPDQDVFECLRDKLARVYLDALDGPTGRASMQDASSLLSGKDLKTKPVDLIVTSPPYLQVVNYGTANWIRLWLLGIDEVGRQRGAGRKSLDAALDHQHNYDSYRDFMLRIFQGIRRVLATDGVAVVVIGDVANPGEVPIPLAQKIWTDVKDRTGLRLLQLIEDRLDARNKVSRIWGETKGKATDRDCILVLGRDDGHPVPAVDEVEWDEPYKDGGPDAAHDRLKDLRVAS